MDTCQDKLDHALLLLAHFSNNLTNGVNFEDVFWNLKILRNLLDADFNVNQKFPDNFLASSEPAVSGGTPLHFVYSKRWHIGIFDALLETGADFTVRNANGQTVLHQMIQDWYPSDCFREELFINSVLSAHMKFQNTSNPRDKDGLTHFHAACMINHTEAVEFFLKNGVSIDEAVSMDAYIFPGYTGLHFAAEFHRAETVEILLDHQANTLVEDKGGMTPLKLIIKDRLFDGKYTRLEHKRMISLFLMKDPSLTTSFFNFYAACTLDDVSWVEGFLEHVPDINQAISMDSRHWPGYTSLHFAGYRNFRTTNFLFKNGANIVAADACGVTPLKICLQSYPYQDVCTMLSEDSVWNKILLSDGKTKLLDLISSMEYTKTLESFLNDNLDVNAIVPLDSPFWPGYTCLHVAIAISNFTYENFVRLCLNHGSDVNVKNAGGQTPIHLAFRLRESISQLLEHLESLPNVVDVVDDDDLSYLHIACRYGGQGLVEKLLPTSDVNLAYKGRSLKDNHGITGWTPLHFAIRGNESVVKLLIDRGADVEAKDARGMTPVHLALETVKCQPGIAAALLACKDLKESTTDYGLTHLHVASAANNVAVVRRLIEWGSNVETVFDRTKYPEWSHYFTRIREITPLELALTHESYDAFVALIKNGARMSTHDGRCTRLLEDFSCPDFKAFADAVCRNDDVRDVAERELGLTRLHVACFRRDVESVERLLNEGAVVNARIHAEWGAFAGYTPLLLLMMDFSLHADYYTRCTSKRSQLTIAKMLLEGGADVALANVKGNTPIHLCLELTERRKLTDEARKLMIWFVAAHQDFSVNPVNADGISHFHVACLVHNVKAVEGFLHNGVDVNQTTNLFCEKYAKFSPLHFAVSVQLDKFSSSQSRSDVINLLLKYGADIDAQDTRGDTPLHQACRDTCTDIGVLKSLISHGTDVAKENVRGETPFELALSSEDTLNEQMKLLIKYGCRFDDSNRLSEEGYIGVFVYKNAAQPSRTILEKMLQFTNEFEKDKMGRTPIHNVVATSKTALYEKSWHCGSVGRPNKNLQSAYREIISFFMQRGVDIDDQDNAGKTALHCAAQFRNSDALIALLALGADINIIDKSGKPAFSYALECYLMMEFDPGYEMLFIQISLRKLVGLRVSQSNENLINELDAESIRRIEYNEADYQRAIEMSKSMSVGESSLCLYDFLSDRKAVVNYVSMAKKDRDEIDDFFKSFNIKDFQEATGIYTLLRSQYNKAVARVTLLEAAAHSLRCHLGFSFTGLCEDTLMYLSSIELKNLIISAEGLNF